MNNEFSNLLNNAMPDTCCIPIYICAFADVSAESPIDFNVFLKFSKNKYPISQLQMTKYIFL